MSTERSDDRDFVVEARVLSADPAALLCELPARQIVRLPRRELKAGTTVEETGDIGSIVIRQTLADQLRLHSASVPQTKSDSCRE